MTDLEQRMRQQIEVEYIASPEPASQAECLDIYRAERSAGTEMPAIIGMLSQYVVSQWTRLKEERRLVEANRLEAARLARERRLLSFGDCPWMQIKGAQFFYCRKNGRVFQLKPNSDKGWNMYRAAAVDDAEAGAMIGRYRSRADANAVLEKAATEQERWR
jgi:hypothetical protein